MPEKRSTATMTAVPTIRDLIRAALDEGRTLRELERASDGRVKFQTFQELANKPPSQFPKYVDTIGGMAQALDVTETTIVLAYAAGLGLRVDAAGNTFSLRLPEHIDTVEPEMQNAIISMARAAVRQRMRTADPDDSL